MAAVPVIALTGYLGAGKTTLLNHVLRVPGARIGLVVNDFGVINVDSTLVSGQIDEPASIAGGCICCLPDDGNLDSALARLADPKLALDAIIVEASGLAEPVTIARMLGFSRGERIRPGGVIDVIDAVNHFDTVDRGGLAPARYAAASLIVVNKLDRVAVSQRSAFLHRVQQRVAERNPDAHVVGSIAGRVDPSLLYDVAASADQPGQLSLRDLLVDTGQQPVDPHQHADSVTVTGRGCIDPHALADLLENPPDRVYRLKGAVTIRARAAEKSLVVNLVAGAAHIAAAPRRPTDNCLVAIGIGLDRPAVRERLDAALRTHHGPAPADGMRRLRRYRRLDD